MKHRIRIMAVACASALGLFLGLYGEGGAAARKEMTIVTGTDVETLDPHITGMRNTQILTEALFEGLVQRNEKNEIQPRLATEWQIGPDKLTRTFRLRKGVKFHDGSPFNAQAVKFSIERILNPETKSNARNLLLQIASVEVADEHTVKIVTKTPFAPLLPNLADMSARVVSPEAVRKYGKDVGQHASGTGPYKQEEYTPAERTVLVRNDDYWGSRGKIERFTFKFAREGAVRAAMIESGQADITTNTPPEAIPRLRKNPALEVHALPSTFLIFFVLDHNKKPLGDVRVRKALNHALDREAIINNILGGLAVPPVAPVGIGVYGQATFKPYAYDVARAKQLLAEAGVPSGFDLEMWAPEGRYLKDREVAEAVQGYLQAVGIRVKLKIMEWGAYRTQAFKSDLTAGAWIIGASIPDAHWNLANNYRTKSYYPNNYSNKKVDDLLAKAGETFDEKERLRILRQVQQTVFEEDAVMLYLHVQKQLLTTKKSVSGLAPLPFEVFYLSSLEFK